MSPISSQSVAKMQTPLDGGGQLRNTDKRGKASKADRVGETVIKRQVSQTGSTEEDYAR